MNHCCFKPIYLVTLPLLSYLLLSLHAVSSIKCKKPISFHFLCRSFCLSYIIQNKTENTNAITHHYLLILPLFTLISLFLIVGKLFVMLILISYLFSEILCFSIMVIKFYPFYVHSVTILCTLQHNVHVNALITRYRHSNR